MATEWPAPDGDGDSDCLVLFLSDVGIAPHSASSTASIWPPTHPTGPPLRFQWHVSWIHTCAMASSSAVLVVPVLLSSLPLCSHSLGRRPSAIHAAASPGNLCQPAPSPAFPVPCPAQVGKHGGRPTLSSGLAWNKMATPYQALILVSAARRACGQLWVLLRASKRLAVAASPLLNFRP